MAKRGYKLQEFVAHSTNVNCLSIGKKACRLFITGGDDHKVNLWAIGKPTSLMSLCGHTSPVESVAFDTAEILVLGGASTGAIKLWNLEEAKMVRTLTGHRSNCTAVEFHPFGEFFASGSADTNLKIWDIRNKGCIHTYKGHTRDISTIRFTPDGRWVVSGGLDNVVKVWDLTAGKLLHDFKFHEGQIRSLDFHPLEFLLATGSADRTVKFWDLETFELIGSARPEATGVRTIAFHPDGRTLFCGLDDSLKVYSWEPVICHDAVDMGWSTLGDLCIHEGKLLGCSYYRNSVGVWVADILQIEPYGAAIVPEKSECIEQKFNIPRSPSDKVGSGVKSASSLRSRSPDYETKEIKNIYVDSTGGKPVTSHRRIGSLGSSEVFSALDSKEMSNSTPEKQSPIDEVDAKSIEQAVNKSLVVPTVVSLESPLEKDSKKETITFSKTKPGMLLRPAHVRRPSNSKIDVERLSVASDPGTLGGKESTKILNSQTQIVSEDGARKSCEGKIPNPSSVSEKFEKVLLPETPSNQEKCDEPINGNKGITSVKIVNGVAVVSGRTRSLVERFERREKFGNEDQTAYVTPHTVPEINRISSIATNVTPPVMPETERTPTTATNMAPCVIAETERTPTTATDKAPHVIPETERTPDISATRTPPIILGKDRTGTASNINPHIIPETDRTPSTETNVTPLVLRETERRPAVAANMISCIIPEMEATSTVGSYRTPPSMPRRHRRTTSATNITNRIIPEAGRTSSRIMCEAVREPPSLKEEPQTSGRDLSSSNDMDVTEDLMQTHDVFSSSLKSRLTKLQVIRHYWERNDIKGAINAMRRLPDHSVQADVVSVLIEKMEILTLDLFSCLLPVLVGLLDSKMERHANVSLEMLLKLVAVFGHVIRATVSAPRAVGVDLHAEQRLECCNRCFVQLQKIQQILPALISKGGLLAKCARELNLVLQEP